MIQFHGKVLIIGCGSVSQCLLPLFLKHIHINPQQVTVLDFVDNRERIKESLSLGILYSRQHITPDNYSYILGQYLSAGDLLIDLAWNLDTVQLIDWCHYSNVLYINTSVEEWNPYEHAAQKKATELTLYHRQMKLKALKESWSRKRGASAVVDHGANPGLVSHLTKQGLIDLVTAIIDQQSPGSLRDELDDALHRHDFPRLAHLSGVKVIHISERDSQITNKPKRVNEFVNTWSIEGFIEEGLAPAELGWGTHERNVLKGTMFHQHGPKNQICLAQKGINTWVRSWVPSGPITGMVIRHGEAYSISQALTVREKNHVIFRPTVNYAYCPCDSAINSLHEFEMRGGVQQDSKRILTDHEIIDGTDELGCLLMGHSLKSWWIGSVLSIQEARKLAPGQNATTLQVAASLMGAIAYIIQHPRLGLCLPDDLNYIEILKIAKPYLGQFISTPVDWSPLQHVQNFINYHEAIPPRRDEWQFSTFLIPPKPDILNV